MDQYESKMLRLIEINHKCRVLADNLNAISARRKNSKSLFKRKTN